MIIKNDCKPGLAGLADYLRYRSELAPNPSFEQTTLCLHGQLFVLYGANRSLLSHRSHFHDASLPLFSFSTWHHSITTTCR